MNNFVVVYEQNIIYFDDLLAAIAARTAIYDNINDSVAIYALNNASLIEFHKYTKQNKDKEK